jgi:hypothetical protein
MTHPVFTPAYRKGSGHKAGCSCGWTAEIWDYYPSAAQDRWTKHVEEAHR